MDKTFIEDVGGSILGSAVLVATLLVVFTYPLSILLGIYIMYSPHLGLEYSRGFTHMYIISYMFAFSPPLKVIRASLFASLMAVYSICLVASAKLGTDVKMIIREPRRVLTGLTNNWLAYMPTVSGMLMILVAFIHGLQESAGVPTGSISLPNPYGGLLALAYSPIMEEIGFRLTPIGTIAAISLARHIKPRMLPLAILWPDEAKRQARLPTIQKHGHRGITLPEWIAAIATSAFFGLVHYISGGGWDVGKISSAAAVGMALAVIYLWKGIHASILLHWFFNYYGYVWEVGEMVHHNIFTYLDVIIYAATILLGVLGWIMLTWKAWKYLKGNSGRI